MPNTFPSNSTGSSGQNELIITGGGSTYPTIQADSTYPGALIAGSVSSLTANIVSGFVGDGDYFVLPTTSTATLDYFDKDNVQITASSWGGGLTIAEMSNAGTAWVGFMLSAADSVIYTVVGKTTTTPDTYYLRKIDAAGTITTIGDTGAGATDFVSIPPIWATPSGNGASSLYREADGSGNFIIRSNQGNELQELIISDSTGAVVTDTALAAKTKSLYKTATGIYCGEFELTSDNSVLVRTAGQGGVTDNILSSASGFGAEAAQLMPLQWDGRIVLASNGTGPIFGPRAYLSSRFNAAIDRIALVSGAS